MASNIVLYRKVLNLKDYLENNDLHEYSAKKIEACIEHVNAIYQELERRGR